MQAKIWRTRRDKLTDQNKIKKQNLKLKTKKKKLSKS